MNKLFYPAIFHTAEEGGFWISFPDFPECLTQGDEIDHAYEMAMDALGLCITNLKESGHPLPTATKPSEISLENDSFMAIVEFDLAAYHRRTNARSVKKTLTIPEWLNEEALARNVNFSQVLQDALMNIVKS